MQTGVTRTTPGGGGRGRALEGACVLSVQPITNDPEVIVFNRSARFIALALAAAAIPTSTAVAMPVDPLVTGSATTGVTIRTDAAQQKSSPVLVSFDRTDAAQTSPAGRTAPMGRPSTPSVPESSPASVPTDGFDWALAGAAALIMLGIAGVAVSLRSTRVSV